MPDAQPTEFAARLIDLAGLFATECGDTAVFCGKATYAPQLTKPELSTAGGRQSVQHLTLAPVEGEGTTLVFGTIIQVAKVAELRTYEYVVAQHAQRYKGAPLALDRDTYKTMVDATRDFFEKMGFRVTLVAEPPAPETSRPKAESTPRTSRTLTISIAAGVALLVAVIAYLWIHHH